MQQLKLANDLFPDLVQGYKRATIREGLRDIELDKIEFISAEPVGDDYERTIVNVISITYKLAKNVNFDEYYAAGWVAKSDFIEGMKRFYPSFSENSKVTIIAFERL